MQFQMNIAENNPPLGKGPATKSDEFFEKFQTAFDPPSFFFGKLY